MTRSCNGYTLTEEDEIVCLARKAVQTAGITPVLEVTGGGSDANVFNAHGIACATLSTGMTRLHTTEEYIAVEDLIRSARVVLELIRANDEGAK